MSGIDLKKWESFVEFLSNNLPQESSVCFNLKDLSAELGISLEELNNLFAMFVSAQELSRGKYECVKTQVSNDEVVFASDKEARELVSLKVEEYQNISDIVYLFKNIRRGRGFEANLDADNSIIEKIRGLNKKFSFLFRRLNGFIYPTEVCYKLGVEALSFKRSNKVPHSLSVLNYQFIIKK